MYIPADLSLIAEHVLCESQTLVELYGERDIADGLEPEFEPSKELLKDITNISMLGGELH